jgi:hypothetical protein
MTTGKECGTGKSSYVVAAFLGETIGDKIRIPGKPKPAGVPYFPIPLQSH